jgi:hypothetical protein
VVMPRRQPELLTFFSAAITPQHHCSARLTDFPPPKTLPQGAPSREQLLLEASVQSVKSATAERHDCSRPCCCSGHLPALVSGLPADSSVFNGRAICVTRIF